MGLLDENLFVAKMEQDLIFGPPDDDNQVIFLQCSGCNNVIGYKINNPVKSTLCVDCTESLRKGELLTKLKLLE